MRWNELAARVILLAVSMSGAMPDTQPDDSPPVLEEQTTPEENLTAIAGHPRWEAQGPYLKADRLTR